MIASGTVALSVDIAEFLQHVLNDLPVLRLEWSVDEKASQRVFHLSPTDILPAPFVEVDEE